MLQMYRPVNARNCLWHLFLCNPWFLCKDLSLWPKPIKLLGKLWRFQSLYVQAMKMSRRAMARTAAIIKPFSSIIPFGREPFSWEISSTEAENGPTRCGRSLHTIPLGDWTNSLSPPLSRDIKIIPGFCVVVCHWKWLHKLWCLFQIELAKWVREGICKWVRHVSVVEVSVALQWWFLNHKPPKTTEN